ncbi:MAG: ankyrin repeat domain-containing protein [Lewinella sp.]|nr:ankyrin repeat domain-containing protein [Lewinella sp.]
MLKIITLINWIVIAILAILVAAEAISPSKGGDAAGRGMAQAFYFLAIVALIALLILNLLPFNATKYVAFGLILLPLVVLWTDSAWSGLKRLASRQAIGRNEDGTPWFQDRQKQQLALAIFEGDLNKVKRYLQEPIPGLHERDTPDEETLLEFAANAAAYATFNEVEKVACVRMLFDAGARFDSTEVADHPTYLAAAFTGSAALVEFLLEHGADPNARDKSFNRPVLFEAISSYKQPNETVQALIDAGADPNTLFTDTGGMTTSALLHAAANQRWNICLRLLEKGADRHFVPTDGKTLDQWITENTPYFQGDGYSTLADLQALKKALEH